MTGTIRMHGVHPIDPPRPWCDILNQASGRVVGQARFIAEGGVDDQRDYSVLEWESADPETIEMLQAGTLGSLSIAGEQN